MSTYNDPATVTALIEGMDGVYDDGREVFISARSGGSGTTSASCEVVLEDGDTGRSQVFRVSVTMPEPDDDDYVGEDD